MHGSWYDPANPVICYEGTLRRDVFRRMKEAKYSADLVLVIGTSLSGLNCDKVAMEASDRSLDAEALGSVIINLQQTEKDGVSSLRIFSNIDDVFRELLNELDLSIDETILWKEPPQTRVTVPYNRNGVRSQRLRMVIDLSEGNKIRLNPGHNCQGMIIDQGKQSSVISPRRLTAALPPPRVWKHSSGVPGCLQTSGARQGGGQGNFLYLFIMKLKIFLVLFAGFVCLGD